MESRQEKQRQKDQNCCRESEIRRFGYEIDKRMTALEMSSKLA
jgi:hypothetical protein